MPIAVKTGVEFMYCFEINDDSVKALQRNIDMNGAHDRCKVWKLFHRFFKSDLTSRLFMEIIACK